VTGTALAGVPVAASTQQSTGAPAIARAAARVIKRQFGLAKVRFRGLAKNTANVVTLFALSNLWMARKQLMAMVGAIRPQTA
jgi:IS5 family transposase